jgi:hypothetical protein
MGGMIRDATTETQRQGEEYDIEGQHFEDSYEDDFDGGGVGTLRDELGGGTGGVL